MLSCWDYIYLLIDILHEREMVMYKYRSLE